MKGQSEDKVSWDRWTELLAQHWVWDHKMLAFKFTKQQSIFPLKLCQFIVYYYAVFISFPQELFLSIFCDVCNTENVEKSC